MSSSTKKQQLWFENIISRIGIGFWPGVVLIVVIPILLMLVISEWEFLFKSEIDVFNIFTNIIPYTLGYAIFMIYAAKYVIRQVEKLREYSKQLLPIENSPVFNLPYNIKGLLASLIFVEVVSFFLDFSFMDIMYNTSNGILQNEISSLYLRFIQATFLWVFGSSMYSIYRIGKLPLRLKNHLEDSTLGLRPFGNSCLKIIIMYVIAVLLTFPIFMDKSLLLLTGSIMFLLLGLPLFFFSLMSLRSKLIKTRTEHLDSINAKQSKVIKKIEAENDSEIINKELGLELLVLDKMKKDIQQIHRWPFDTTIIAQLGILIGAPVFVSLVAELLKSISGL